MRPAPKKRSLQTGPSPQVEDVMEDPNAPLGAVTFHRPLVGGSPGALPSESYQYDVVFDEFRKDHTFWKNWNVIGCARNNMNESISKDNATIRVVMDLPPTQVLYPTAYTPGFQALPGNGVPHGHAKAEKPKLFTDLPPGYTVALEVHLLEDARIMLDFQRSFRNGKADPKYDWLEAIVAQAAKDTNAKAITNGSGTKAKHASSPKSESESTRYNKMLENHPEARLRPPVGSMITIDEGVEIKTATLKTFSDDLAAAVATAHAQNHGRQSGHPLQRVAGGFQQVYEENTLVSAFGDHFQMPPRESGSWAERPKRTPEERQRRYAEGQELDEKLETLLERTRERNEE